MFFRLLCLSLTALFLCCHEKDSRLSTALQLAGSNRAEIEKVLTHYRNEPLKHSAAEQLIANMIGKYSMDSAAAAPVQPFYDLLTNYLEKHGRYADTTPYYLCDSLYELLDDFQPGICNYKPDLTFLSSRFLIDHIDRSFETWYNSPWSRELDFETFCRFVLPYKSDNDHWEGTYPYLREKYAWAHDTLNTRSAIEAGKYLDSTIKWNFTQNGPFFGEYPYMLPLSRYNYIHAQLGTCIEANNMVIMTLRSLGIPATMNFIPYWGNSNASHSWTEVIGNRPVKLYDNTQFFYRDDRDEVISDIFWFKYPFETTEGIPEAVEIRSCRTVPKVYRSNFFASGNAPSEAESANMPDLFRNPGIEDVTDHYIECANVKVSFDKKNCYDRHAYLCCYDPENLNWTPVAWAEIHRGKARFEKIGKNIVYLPAFYRNGQFDPAGPPFLLTNDGNMLPLEPEASETVPEIVLYSKVPYRTHVLFYAYVMLHCQFKTANKSDLSDTVTIHSIDRVPYYGQQVEIRHAAPARYAIYDFGDSPYGFIGELEFWGDDGKGQEVRLEGTPIGNHGIYGQTNRELCDGDRVSHFYRDPNGPNYVGFDFGKPCRITRIVYHPRSDDNGIVPGEIYELFCWQDGTWRSLGRQTGREDKTLKYEQAPAHALFRLHNCTRGKENRIFIYRNGKQIFY